MRLAYFSPLPPARSGIADYSAALLDCLKSRVEVDVFSSAPPAFDPSRYDALLYQIGNNSDHAFVYDAAMKYPGTVVLHEANLHHLIADVTIRRNDWDGYIREVEFDGGDAAMERGRRVRALEIGPDYDGLPMIRRLLSRSKAVAVHSRFVENKVREAGFEGPVRVIPHGTWIPSCDGIDYRSRLGLTNGKETLVGIFGHLKPYKRIAESLRAFRRLVREHPEARLILVGEPHPELPLEPLIDSLRLEGNVRIVGHAPIEDFTGYLAACDIVLNLRYPTVGETSGTLHRALGLGRAVVVSDVGAFAEFPDDICLKVPPGTGEEDLIFEFLRLLARQPELAQAMGQRARAWVEQQCGWDFCAERYIDFLSGKEAPPSPSQHSARHSGNASGDVPDASAITAWTNMQPSGHDYVEEHLARLVHTLAITPPGTDGDRILEMGAYMQITPALHFERGYGEVRGCYFGTSGEVDRHTVTSEDGREFHCEIDLFDAEKDTFPYPDGHFATVLCCELIEHLPSDPMHTLSEIHRVLRDGGYVVLTTPNIISLRAVAAILESRHPGFFTTYLRPQALERGDSRHNREYTPWEIAELLSCAGFEVVRLETGPFKDEANSPFAWVEQLIDRLKFDLTHRGDGIYAVGRKTHTVRERYPAWLYSG